MRGFRGLLAIAGLLFLAASSEPSSDLTTFPPAAAPSVGDAWVEDAAWRMTGYTKVHLGPAKVRDKSTDDGVSWSASVQVTALDDDRVSGLEVTFARARRIAGDEEFDLGLDGLSVVGRGTDKRKWKNSGRRGLKKKARDFLAERFSSRGERGDLLGILLPEGGVAVGDSWDVDMERVVDELGRDRFSLDRESSRARASLVALVERRGVAFGRISFDVVVVPSTIKDAEFREARLQATGIVELPLEAGRPDRVLKVDLHTRYDGWIKRKGIKATNDFDHTTVGREERR